MSAEGVPTRDDIHAYFSLSYASWLCLPRTLLQSIPAEWQEQLVELLREYDVHWRRLPDGFLPREYRVQPTEDGRLVPWRNFTLPHYNRGRAHVDPDGKCTGVRIF